MRFLLPLALLVALLGAMRAHADTTPRRLLDEVVAVVEAQSITLSDLASETRIELVLDRGAQMATVPLSRGLLAASLRKLLQERLVLVEVERLRLGEPDRAELDKRRRNLRERFPTQARYEQFLRSLEITDEEVEAVLGRALRVERYLDNRLRLTSQLRGTELADAAAAQGGLAKMTRAQQESLRRALSQAKYDRQLQELLADLRKRTSVRILDPIEQGSSDADAPAGQ
jgi:hypothetical protein